MQKTRRLTHALVDQGFAHTVLCLKTLVDQQDKRNLAPTEGFLRGPGFEPCAMLSTHLAHSRACQLVVNAGTGDPLVSPPLRTQAICIPPWRPSEDALRDHTIGSCYEHV